MQVIKANTKWLPDIAKMYPQLLDIFSMDSCSFLNDPRFVLFPGFCDVHVHFREPGFLYKETILSGSRAAARGGYTAVATMPNLSPVPDSVKNLMPQVDAIDKAGLIHVYPYGAITCGERGEQLSDMEALKDKVIAFSDDGRGVQSESVMRSAMEMAAKCGIIIAAHCEDNRLLCGGYIHDGAYARAHGHKGICSESEWQPIERDIRLARETGCAYHVCHISCAESVALIRRAKQEGVNITCETAPHYLILCDEDIQEDGRFKMNPPLRSRQDKEALIEGVIDGTIDMIATDHAPHSAEEKAKGLEDSAFGVVGLETAFPALYTYLIKPNILSMTRLLSLLVYAPRERFSLPLGNDFCVWDLETSYAVDPTAFLSKGRATPFENITLWGECKLTVCDGRVVYRKE